MQTINRLIGSFDDLLFEVDLSGYGKSLSDVSEILFMVKNNSKDDDDALLLKKRSEAEIVATETDSIVDVLVQWGHDEYTMFNTKNVYTAGLFFKFEGDPAADEHVDQLFELKIVQDFSRA